MTIYWILKSAQVKTSLLQPAIGQFLDIQESYEERHWHAGKWELTEIQLEECKALHMERNNLMQQHMLEAHWLESKLAKKVTEIPVDTKLKVSQKHNLVTNMVNGILSHIKCCQLVKVGGPPPLFLTLVGPQLEFWVQPGSPSTRQTWSYHTESYKGWQR